MANEKTENGVQGFPYLKPPDQTTWEKISTALYNKSENTILGRTPINWREYFFVLIQNTKVNRTSAFFLLGTFRIFPASARILLEFKRAEGADMLEPNVRIKYKNAFVPCLLITKRFIASERLNKF